MSKSSEHSLVVAANLKFEISNLKSLPALNLPAK